MGALLEADGTLFATFPGVPTEMERMFEETLEPLIRRHSEGIIVSQTLRFAGISEEELADEVRSLPGLSPARRLRKRWSPSLRRYCPA